MWQQLRGRGKRPSGDGGNSATPARKPPVPTRADNSNSRSVKDVLPQKGSQGGSSEEGTIPAHPSCYDSGTIRDGANNVKVLIRLRPLNNREKELAGDASNLHQVGSSGLHLAVEDRDYNFKFDEVLGVDGSQEELFKLAGQPMVSNVMQGYNACCFAYGQTGAGKTHTMQGELGPDASGGPSDLRGLAPRVFQQVFQAIENKEGDAAGAQLQYTCRCSFLQIYNEQISDLLHPAEKPLALRYDSESGVYVENLTEHVVVNVEDAMALMKQGASNRCVGETKMNRVSSRSHSVFSMKVECRTTMENGISKLRYGTLHIVDLAGSERVKISGATGAALTEAAEINVSLTTLGRVISKVVESQASKQVGRHIPYRDSKLTFLLQDSLGGNAKTMLVANVSPSTACAHETLSTLQFAERAKCIRNRAKVNTDTQGDHRALQAEVERLQAELSSLQDGVTGPLRAERDELKERLDEVSSSLRDATARLDNVTDERDQLQFQLSRLDEKLIKKESDLARMEEEIKTLKDKSAADIAAAHAAATEELDSIGKAHASALAAATAAKEAMATEMKTEKDAAIRTAAQEQEATLSRVKAEAEDRLKELRESTNSKLAELEKRCKDLIAERDAANRQREEVENRLTGELEEGLRAAAQAAEEAAAEARQAAVAAEDAHAKELEAIREQLHGDLATAIKAAEARVREEETQARHTAVEAVTDKHTAELKTVQTELSNKLSDVEMELEAARQAHQDEQAKAKAAADTASELADSLQQKLSDMEDAATKQKEASEATVQEMRVLQEKAAADALQLQQKLEAEFTEQSETVSELEKSLEDLRAKLSEKEEAVKDSQEALKEKEKSLEDGRNETAALEKQLSEQKTESQKTLESIRSELAGALQGQTAAEARIVQAEAMVNAKAESLDDARAEITHLKKQCSDLEDRLSLAQQALTTATEDRMANEKELQSAHNENILAAKTEAASTARAEAEAVRLRDITAVTDQAVSSEKALREEHKLEVEKIRSEAKAASEALEKEVAELREQVAAGAANLAAVQAELSRVQRDSQDAADAAASDVDRLENEMAELLDAKDEEIDRLRVSLERAEAHEQSEVATLQAQLVAQGKEAASLRAQMRDALASAADVEAAAAADASAAREKWAAETSKLEEERNAQRKANEEAAATHESKMQELKAQYESQLAAAKETATDAVEACQQEKAAAAAAHTSAAAAAERESLLKQSLREAEERCVSASSQLGASQQHVQELEAKLAALADDLAAQKSATEAAERTAGDAAQQYVGELQDQLQQLQVERDQMQTDVHSFEQQLHEQDQRYRESAVESVTKIQALERHIAEVEDALGRSEALRSDLQADLEAKEQMYEEATRSNQMFSHLLDNIQEQICGAGSRPGSAASAQGGNNAEAMIGAVRQSLDAAGLGRSLTQRQRTPQRPGKLSAAGLRPSALTSESPTHNEYTRRERGLGKPCFTMDMGMAQHSSSSSLQACGGKDGASGNLAFPGASGPNSQMSAEENASPNASNKGFSRPWDTVA